jgi:hypothetical protein
MKRIIPVFICIPMILSGCAATNFTFDIVNQDEQKWSIYSLNSFEYKNLTHISGKMKAKSEFELPHGHIDIAIISPSGDLITEKKTDYTKSNTNKRLNRRTRVYFSIVISEEITNNSIVYVAFHRDDSSKSSIEHKENIAVEIL